MAFHLVTSFACATTGTASASVAPNTANRPNLAAFMGLPLSLSRPAAERSANGSVVTTFLLSLGGVNVRHRGRGQKDFIAAASRSVVRDAMLQSCLVCAAGP